MVVNLVANSASMQRLFATVIRVANVTIFTSFHLDSETSKLSHYSLNGTVDSVLYHRQFQRKPSATYSSHCIILQHRILDILVTIIICFAIKRCLLQRCSDFD